MLEHYYSKRGLSRAAQAFGTAGFSDEHTLTTGTVNSISFGSLPPFLRMLLVTDGTITKSLEAYYWEPIRVDDIRQTTISAQADIEWLASRRGDQVVQRQVTLRGVATNHVYAHASSVLLPLLIPAPFRMKLMEGSIGIGELIRDCCLETYRELLEIGLTGVPDENGECTLDGRAVYRTYRITLKGRPAILVTERFPRALR